MSIAEITVRPLETAAERDTFYWLSSQTFGPPRPEAEKERAIAGERRYMEQAPGFDPIMLRGAFRGATFLGGYYIQERLLRVGKARLRTVCIGNVVTHPDFRLQGVASALMRDAIAYARARKQALLLLDGIARFYHRFGYIDMFDMTEQCISRATAWTQSPGPCTLRPATAGDASTLLALYQRHYGAYAGSFERTLEEQQHQLAGRLLTHNPPVLALHPDGQPAGYLVFPWGSDRTRAVEVAADSLSAVIALLQHHAQVLDALPEPPAEIVWRVPSDSPTAYLLIDHLLASETTTRQGPARAWSVQSQTYHHPDTGWLARPGALQALVEAMLPEWEERWQRSAARWSGALAFAIGDERFALDLRSAGVAVLEQIPVQAPTITLTPQALTQALFGYRPITWALQHDAQALSDDLLLALTTLFPPIQTWIAGSDDF